MAAEPIIFWNLDTLLLAGTILVMKIKFAGKRSHKPKPIITEKIPVKDLKDWGI